MRTAQIEHIAVSIGADPDSKKKDAIAEAIAALVSDAVRKARGQDVR